MYAYRVLADLFYDHRYSHTRMTNPDFVLLAKAMGVHAIRVNSSSELPEKMKEFLEYDGNKPVLLECVVEPNEHVFPMVRPSGWISLDPADPSLVHRFLQARHYMNRSCTPHLGTRNKTQKHNDQLFTSCTYFFFTYAFTQRASYLFSETRSFISFSSIAFHYKSTCSYFFSSSPDDGAFTSS